MGLRVHRWYGESVSVLRRFGTGGTWVQRADGDLRIVPVKWTELRPRRAPLSVGDLPVRLAPSAGRATALAAGLTGALSEKGAQLLLLR